ncbi:hypothetical protein OQA88_10632 [Cercophora sp. LCS_1]
MSITFGSVGDIISVSLLAKDLITALSSAKGSSAEYRAITRELHFLDQALLKVESLARTTQCCEVQALRQTAAQTVERCRTSIKEFLEKIRKYDQCLANTGGGSVLKDAARKAQWKVCNKQEEIEKFRVELTGYTDSLSLILATIGLESLEITSAKSESILDTHAKKAESAWKECNTGLREIQDRMAKNTEEICKRNSLGKRLFGRVEWVGSLCGTLKEMLCCVIAGNCLLYQELLCLKRILCAPRGFSLTGGEEPVIFEDACGAVVPIHLSLVDSWFVFQAVMESRFRGRPGLSKLRRQEYGLREQGTDRQIPLSGDIRRAMIPGTTVVQEILFEDYDNPVDSGLMTTCPFCHGEQPSNDDTGPRRCSRCSRFFRREAQSATHSINLLESEKSTNETISTKRKRGENERRFSVSDLDLYQCSRRICIVAREDKDSGMAAAASVDAVLNNGDPPPQQLLTCNNIWERLQQCPMVQSGDFDLDGLCSDLQEKAKCSGAGAVVAEDDFQLIMNKYLSPRQEGSS